MNKIELLVPAKNLAYGQTAINHGADALYIGAPMYGARQAAGNSLQDLEQLIRYAHLYGSKVYVTVNTLLYDDELEDVRQLIHRLYDIGTDALIIQDLGILKMDIPPIRLHASTQCHNNSLERVQFMQKLGMKRAILAREMDLETIKSIRQNSSIELETFIHGALCVCYSGQCYMSRMTTGRSGNRGECAQICRTSFDLLDGRGRTLMQNKHLLSLRDMNRSKYIRDIINAGVVSLKVEGRLKDENYVKNITSYYRQILDGILEGDADCRKSGSGKTTIFFNPDPTKTFTRGFTSYYIDGNREKIASFETPKAMGRRIGSLRQDRSGRVFYDGWETIANGDGLCFVNDEGTLEGFSVNRVEGDRLFPHKPLSVFRQVDVFRNVDRMFEKSLADKTAERKISLDMIFKESENGFILHLRDEDGCEVDCGLETPKIAAKNPEMADRQLRTSLAKLGNSPFELRKLIVESLPYFLQASVVNKLRSDAVELLQQARVEHFRPQDSPLDYQPEPLFDAADYKRNITNELHRAVYEDFGAGEIEYGLDKTLDFKDKELMACKYCLRYELGICSKQKKNPEVHFPLYLKDANNNRFRLEFDCKNCVMKVMM